MNVTKLPIDLIPNTMPPRFRWRQRVSIPTGYSVQENEGMLPPSVESAVVELVSLTKQLLKDNAMLQGHVDALKEKAGEQSQTAPTKQVNQPTGTGKRKG
jgi:hypothetical protein